jgi:MFS transporter, DHA2 family, multidrug resistance protein
MVDKYTTKDQKFRRNLAFFGMVVGMFMAVLDIQIVASSLPVIGAGLSATQDELSWVQTSYIIAEVVIIPLTGFTAKLLSTRISYCIAAVGFTIMSIGCAFAGNLETMILCRALQGFFGGAMIPTVFGIIYIIFEPKERPAITIMIGLVVTVAPTLGPTLGGYITDILSWHFMFLLNVIPGIIVCYIVYNFADFDEPNYTLAKNFDYLGIFLLITSLGCLQFVLEEGSRKDWFESNEILALTIYSMLGLIYLVYHELTTKNPILDLRAFKNLNFAIGCTLSGILGVGLYGSVFLLPIFLGSHFIALTTIQIGIVMAIMGIAQFVSAPVAGALMGKNIDRRYMMAFGISLYAFGCYLNSFMTLDTRFYELIIPQAVRGFALMFCFIPINDLSLGTLPKDKVQDASGLYNLMRNLGGAFGLAVINSKLNNNIIINKDILSSNIAVTNPYAQHIKEALEFQLADKMSDAYHGSLAIMEYMLTSNSFVISVNNMFAYIGIFFSVGLLLIPFMKNSSTEGDANVH